MTRLAGSEALHGAPAAAVPLALLAGATVATTLDRLPEPVVATVVTRAERLWTHTGLRIAGARVVAGSLLSLVLALR